MSNWKSETIQSNGLQIFYTRTGGNKPSFVLAHGFSDDGLCWTPIAQVLEKHYDVIMVDARGHGRAAALLLVIAPVHVHLLELLGVPSGHAL